MISLSLTNRNFDQKQNSRKTLTSNFVRVPVTITLTAISVCSANAIAKAPMPWDDVTDYAIAAGPDYEAIGADMGDHSTPIAKIDEPAWETIVTTIADPSTPLPDTSGGVDVAPIQDEPVSEQAQAEPQPAEQTAPIAIPDTSTVTPEGTYAEPAAAEQPQQQEPAQDAPAAAAEEWHLDGETASFEQVAWPSAPSPVPGFGGMTDDGWGELSMALEIFDCYNEWRVRQGLPATQWDGVCAEMAVNSAKGCAERRKLVHRLGIPADLQTSYSDILQYASWRMDATEAIQRWENSTGHKAQMMCPTAQNAAVGVYCEGGIYWFAIVYTFQGTNIG